MDSYYELVFPDGARRKLDGVTTLESAKAAAKSVADVTETKVSLQKVTPIDHTAPPQVRRSNPSAGSV